MAESYVQAPVDDVGKKLHTIQHVVGANTVEDEVMELADSTQTIINPAKEDGNLAAVAADTTTIAADTTSIDGKVTACNTGAVTVSTALPAGSNTIGTVNTKQAVTYDHAVFDASASGNLVAAAGAGLVTKVHHISMQSQGTVTVNITDGSGGASLMEWKFEAREGVVSPFCAYPAHIIQTSANTALYATLSAAVVVTINCIYSDEDAS